MRPRHLALLLRLSLFVAIAASAALVADYRSSGDPAFCGVDSGCFAVRISGYANVLGMSLPNLGLAAFATLLAGSLLARSRLHHLLVGVAAGVGAVAALVLIYLQAAVIGAFCAWCVAVDIGALIAAAAAGGIAVQARKAGDEEAFAREVNPGGAALVGWVVAALGGIGLPMMWAQYPTLPALPQEIAAVQVPGKVTLVGFTDFECPFCRRLAPELHQIEEEFGDRIVYIRKMAPLPRHEGALPAAKAYVCAPPEQREGAAALLYTASAERLTEEGVVGVLGPLKLDREALVACLAAPETKAAVEAEVALYKKVAGKGLPYTFVGRRVVLGFNPARIDESIKLELAGQHFGLPLWGMFVALGLVAAGAAAVSLRAKGSGPGEKG
ncbi:MAG TPA: vitamin K epoxide reductase family protein [Candidatus Nanopelagicales bacterium]|nr:vitamin K epoxide reductase family protein [Candidatus Nanopelagicales bacterium]